MDYSQRVKTVLAKWSNEAAEIGDKYLEFNIVGLTDLSINAHELNSYLSSLKREGGFHNKLLLKKIAIACARITAEFERVEKEVALNSVKEEPKVESKAKKKTVPK